MTKQWNKYREIIIAEYKDQNKPLHEVQRIMLEKYGFWASTRAYRSRFDRWGIHKYTRRRHSVSPGRRGAAAKGETRLSPRQTPDVEAAPAAVAAAAPGAAPGDLIGSGVYMMALGMEWQWRDGGLGRGW